MLALAFSVLGNAKCYLQLEGISGRRYGSQQGFSYTLLAHTGGSYCRTLTQTKNYRTEFLLTSLLYCGVRRQWAYSLLQPSLLEERIINFPLANLLLYPLMCYI